MRPDDIAVTEMAATRADAYREFVSSAAPSSWYASLEFQRFLARIVRGRARYLLATDADEQIIGAMPVFSTHEPRLGTVFNSLPWYGSHGGCIVLPGDPRAAAIRSAVLRKLCALFQAEEGISANLVLPITEQPLLGDYLAASGASVGDYRICQMTALPAPGDELEQRLGCCIKQKTRNLVRKSLRQGFLEWTGDDEWAWRFLHEVHVENMRAVGGQPKPRTHFDALRESLPPDRVRLSVAMLEDNPVAAMLLVLWGDTVEYLTPVIRVEHRSKQPLSFLIWLAMLKLVDRGYRRWNWGGTWIGQKSLHHFKAGWGATDHPYNYVLLARNDSAERLRPHRGTLSAMFPYYYVYPFAKLDD